MIFHYGPLPTLRNYHSLKWKKGELCGEQYFKDLPTFWLPECWLTNTRTPLSDILGSGRRSCWCRWRWRYSRRCWRLQGNVEEGHISWVVSWVGGGGQGVLKTGSCNWPRCWIDVTSRSKYVYRGIWLLNLLPGSVAGANCSRKQNWATNSISRKRNRVGLLAGVRSLPTLILTPNSWH